VLLSVFHFLETIDALADSINNFTGGVVLVSHDMRLISQVAKEVWECKDRVRALGLLDALHPLTLFSPPSPSPVTAVPGLGFSVPAALAHPVFLCVCASLLRGQAITKFEGDIVAYKQKLKDMLERSEKAFEAELARK
jgi:H+/gluconate symporter-like permease